jgi:uncharacterized protein (TIGR03437 family)
VTGSGFDSPTALCFDAQDNLYVSDFRNARVLVFSGPVGPNAVAATVLGQASPIARVITTQASASTLAGPAGLGVDAGGSLYVSVPGENRVLVFAPRPATAAAASAVLGQSSFTFALPNSGSFPRSDASTLAGPGDVKVDPEGNVFIADTGNHRVVALPPNARAANRVWGQGDFTANGANRIKPGSINSPYKIAIDYSQSPFPLYVSDTNNHRILIWRDASRFRTGNQADLVIGQPDLSTALPNVDTRGSQIPSRTSLNGPRGIALDSDGNLYVADSGNHRVLRYPRPVAQSGRIAPDAVLGQPGFSEAASAVVTAGSLRLPSGVWIGPNGNLFVADSGNHRVLEFARGAGTGATAIRVYGQADFTAGSPPPAASAQTLMDPQGVFVDAAYNLYVADFGSHRVLIFPNTREAPPRAASAAIVLGQENFTSNTAAAGAARLRSPIDVVGDSQGRIYVSDTGNNRVLVFPSLVLLPISGGAATGVIGQRNLTGASPNFNTPDGLATPEGLFQPAGLFVDRRDTLYVGDTGNNRVVHFLRPVAVVHAAHFQPGVSVGRGALLSLFTNGLGGEPVAASDLPLPKELSGREVVINDETQAPLLFVSPGQINFQMPWSAPVGNSRIAVRVAATSELLAGGTLAVSSASPGFFSASQDGRGQGAVLNQDGRPNGPSNPAARGTVVTLFGTGQGEVSPAVPDGEAAPSGSLARTVAEPTSDGAACLTSQPSVCVAIGSTFGEVLYSGLAPGFVGLWQVNVRIPNNALTGDAVPVRAVVNASPSNLISVAIR